MGKDNNVRFDVQFTSLASTLETLSASAPSDERSKLLGARELAMIMVDQPDLTTLENLDTFLKSHMPVYPELAGFHELTQLCISREGCLKCGELGHERENCPYTNPRRLP